MVDIHSHVLFGLDDGARTIEDSVTMIRMAAEYGTTALVATPHANPEYEFEPERIAEHLAELSAATQGVENRPELYTGCDFHLSYDNIQDALENPNKYTIRQKNYLLVEFSELFIFKNMQEIFANLLDAGMLPVITHPERNELLRQRVEEIAAWVESGVFVQVTGQSLTGRFGKTAQEFCRVLLDRGLVHFIASDGHDCEYRPPRMDKARTWLEENYGDAVAENLCVTNPRAAVDGEPLKIVPIEANQSRKWYRFWK